MSVAGVAAGGSCQQTVQLPEAMLASTIMLPQETMLRSVFRAASGDSGDVCGLHCLPQETVWKSMIRAAAGCDGQGNFLCSGIDGCRFITESRKH